MWDVRGLPCSWAEAIEAERDMLAAEAAKPQGQSLEDIQRMQQQVGPAGLVTRARARARACARTVCVRVRVRVCVRARVCVRTVCVRVCKGGGSYRVLSGF